MKLELGDLEETALIPLAARANETKRKNARIKDDKAVQIIESLQIDTKDLDKIISHESVVARTILFDETVRKYINKYPDAVCLNIGCGLDDRLSRVDNGHIDWYDIDLPDTISLRHKFYQESLRQHMLACNVLDENWTQTLPKDKPVIVIAEGLFMYFDKDQMTFVLKSLTENFNQGILLVELMRQRVMKEKIHDTVKHTKAKFGKGIDKTGKELLALNSRLRFVKETSFSDQMKKNGIKSNLLGTVIGELHNRLSEFEWGN